MRWLKLLSFLFLFFAINILLFFRSLMSIVGSFNNTSTQFRLHDHNTKLIPIYYINLQRSPERRKHMEMKFKDGFVSDRIVMKQSMGQIQPRKFVRMNAIDGMNLTELEEVLFYKDDSITPQHLLAEYKATRGEVALTMSHFKAIKQAYEDGNEVALILEDDAGDELTHFWTHTPEDLVAFLDLENVGDKIDGFNWSMIRLSLTLKPSYKHFYKKWYEDPQGIRFMDGKSCCYSAVAQLVSRRGMLEILNAFEISENKFDCSGVRKEFGFNSTFKCAADHILPAAMSRVLLAVPPLFSYRLLEGTTGVRCYKKKLADCKLNTHNIIHEASFLTSLKWAIESRGYTDAVLTGQQEISLSGRQWVVVDN